MARIYGLGGTLVRFTRNDKEYELHGDPPAFDDMLEFDGDTNKGVVEGLDTDWNAHHLSGGVLRRNDQIVTINAPGENYLVRKQADRIKKELRDLLAGLGQIDNVVDFGYTYRARLLAKTNGESPATIQTIVDRDTASAYITGMNQVRAMTAAQRRRLTMDLEVQAYDAMVIRLLLT